MWFRSTFVLFRKSLLLKIRDPIQTTIEFLLPIALLSSLIIGYSLAGTEERSAKIYANETLDTLGIENLIIASLAAANFTDGTICFIPNPTLNSTLNETICVNATLPSTNSTGTDFLELVQEVTSYSGPLPIPSFDGFVGLHNVVSFVINNSTISQGQLDAFLAFSGARLGNLLSLGKLFFAPATSDLLPAVNDLVDWMNRSYMFFDSYYGQTFSSESEAMEWVLAHPGTGSTWGVAVFHELDPVSLRLDCTLRFNYSTLPSTRTIVNPLSKGVDLSYQGYYTSGFLSLQQSFFAYMANLSSIPPNVANTAIWGIPFPTVAYSYNIFYASAGSIIAVVMCIAMLYPVSRFVKDIVDEKGSGMRAVLMGMGLPGSAWHSSWYIFGAAEFAILGLMTTLIVKLTFLPRSSSLIVLIFFVLFCQSLVTLSLVIASIFTRAKLAGIISPVVVFAAVLPRYVFFSTTIYEARLGKVIVSLFSPTAFSFGAENFISYEGAGEGISWGNVTEGAFSVLSSMVMLIVDTLLYALIAWYLNNVLPQDYGPRLPFYFLFDPRYWLGQCLCSSCVRETSKGDEECKVESGPNIEPAAPDAVPVIRMCGVTKEFQKGQKAVDNLTLTLHGNQICCLLGHNGAGKSTTISMLTGVLSPTQGTCLLEGQNVHSSSTRYNSQVGICPQRNVMWPSLTVSQHLSVIAGIKAIPYSEVHDAISDIARKVGLGNKVDSAAHALSGGMKRKLCLAMALLGDSRVVFLDEPTSGMDPYSRHYTWDLLRDFGKERTLILTTHYMDEADELGQRIVVLSQGRLCCAGSSLFLKTHYGLSYSLTLEIGKHFQSKELHHIVHAHISGASEGRIRGSEIEYSLPLGEVARFSGLFRVLEAQKESLGVGSFGLSMSTLEDVFVKLATKCPMEIGRGYDQERDHDSMNEMNTTLPGSSSLPEIVEVTHKMESISGGRNLWDIRNPPISPFLQVPVMVKKRWLNARRDTKGLALQILVPVVVVALVLLILMINVNPAGPYIALNGSLYASSNDTKAPFPCVDNAPTRQLASDITGASSSHFLPEVIAGARDSLALSEHLLETVGSTSEKRYAGVALEDYIHQHLKFLLMNGTTVEFDASFEALLTVLINTTSTHAFPAALAEIDNGLLQQAIPSDNATLPPLFSMATHPLPLTGQGTQQIQTVLAVIAALFLLIPFSFVSANFVVFLVKERSSKAKHIQITSGVNLYSFWCGNIIFDGLLFTLITLVIMIVFAAYQNQAFVGSPAKFFATLLLLLLFGLSTLAMAYLFAFVFHNPTSAQLGIAAINLMLGFALVIASFVLDAVPSTQPVNAVLKYFYRIFPPFLFGEGLISLSTVDLQDLILGSKTHPFSWLVIGRPLVLMALEWIGCLALTILIDTGMLQVIWHRMRMLTRGKAGPRIHDDSNAEEAAAVIEVVKLKHGSEEDDENEDFDVALERQRIEGSDIDVVSSSGKSDVVVLKSLRKVYGSGTDSKVAVRNLSIGIPVGECFGLLGVNGAGKTTTLSMLTHDLPPTSGDGFVCGLSVSTDFGRARQEMGYCPQFDPLLDKMTGREHIRMFGRLRGIPNNQLEEAAEQLLDLVGLRPWADGTAETYSGGNKRKLSLALALVGAPTAVFLDEPSSGMDPVARRAMWKVIGGTAESKGVILTTHSMEECEALCSRVGILAGGRLAVLGSVQHLKSRFGSGYRLNLKIGYERMDEVMIAAMTAIPQAVVEEKTAGHLKFLLSSTSIPLSQIFQSLENIPGIDEYSVSQPTLEQVFIAIAMKQAQRDEMVHTE